MNVYDAQGKKSYMLLYTTTHLYFSFTFYFVWSYDWSISFIMDSGW